jgi:hypothetical protein
MSIPLSNSFKSDLANYQGNTSKRAREEKSLKKLRLVELLVAKRSAGALWKKKLGSQH